MHTREKIELGILLCATSIMLNIGSMRITGSSNGATASRGTTVFPLMFNAQLVSRSKTPIDPALRRVAERLDKRIIRRGLPSPPLAALVDALREQRTLLSHHLTVTFALPDQSVQHIVQTDLQQNPAWMQPTFTASDAHFAIQKELVKQSLDAWSAATITAPTAATLTSTNQDGDILRAQSDAVATEGILIDVPTATEKIVAALVAGTPEELTLPLERVPGTIINAIGIDLGAMKLVGVGLSDYAGSPWSRVQNIEKALNEHINNVLIAPGATFSFNALLGGPVTTGNGWYMAKVIVNGGDLIMAPGGGICQTSTTVLRAVLSAGLPIEKRANHSLYVSYYEKYGVGIDATVLPGAQDFTFINDSPSYLLLQAYNRGTEVVVNMYGTPDGRSTVLRGPYFAQTEASDAPFERPLKKNEIGWVQEVTYADGRAEDRTLISRYNSGIPRSLPTKYTLHASAGTDATMR